MPYFFLSYAHGTDDGYVAMFFADLCAELLIHIDEDPRMPVGFRDHDNLRAGSAWPLELVDAVSKTRTFIPLYTPRYFRSDFCGREWAVFASRVAAYERATGRDAPALIPLMWVPTDRVPAHLAHIQHGDPTFGADYARHGARDLVRLRRHRDAYLKFVTAVAVRVNEIATRFPIPALTDRPNFDAVPNAFDSPDLPRQGERPASTDPEPGPEPVSPARGDRPILRYETDTS